MIQINVYFCRMDVAIKLFFCINILSIIAALIAFTLTGDIMSQPAEAVSPEITQLSHYVNGEHVVGSSGRFGDIFNPSRGVKISEVPLASKSEVEAAIAVAEAAFPDWAATSVLQRSRIMARYVQLLYKHQEELATLVSKEHGKVIEDVMGSVLRACWRSN